MSGSDHLLQQPHPGASVVNTVFIRWKFNHDRPCNLNRKLIEELRPLQINHSFLGIADVLLIHKSELIRFNIFNGNLPRIVQNNGLRLQQQRIPVTH